MSYEPEEVKICRKKVKDIDHWIDEYNGKDEKIINKKLDEQERCLNIIKKFQTNLIESNK